MPVDTGHDAKFSVDGGTTTFVLNVVSITQGAQTIPDVDISHLGLAGQGGAPTTRQFIPGDLIDAGTITLRCQADANKTDPIMGQVSPCVLTYPKSDANAASAKTVSGQAFINRRTPPSMNSDELQFDEFELRWNGKKNDGSDGGPVYVAEPNPTV